jgi:signal transduction histidine kinase
MTRREHDRRLEDRVLVFAPVGRDGDLTRDLLDRAGLYGAVFPSVSALVKALDDGGAALLMSEEALDDVDIAMLVTALGEQPPWSDIPVLLFAGGGGVDMSLRSVRSLETLRNVTLLERPIRVAAVLSAVRAALRSRERQYEVRDLLVALHRARADAESANRLKDEFLATLSHELRTPLNAILGWTSMLTRGQVESTRLPRVFEALDRNAQAQAQLIADVLDVSRIITGKLQLEITVADVCDLVARAADAVRPAAYAKNISLVLQRPAGCLVRADSARLQQVFWNLLSNAVKFTPAGGAIRVDIEPDESILVAVTDSGVGIPGEFVPFVFERFRQADQTATRAHGGLGLGLSIVRHLVELHGGTVTASSPGLGRGARFEVRLPPLEPEAAAPELGGDAPDVVSLDGYLILILDDDESTREVVAAALEAAHAEVHVAASAKEARAFLAVRQPALIIADLGMPGEDGFAFIRRVRQSGARHVPAIALSAYADLATRDAALSAGFSAFVAKPTRAQELVDMAGSLLDLTSSRSGSS